MIAQRDAVSDNAKNLLVEVSRVEGRFFYVEARVHYFYVH